MFNLKNLFVVGLVVFFSNQVMGMYDAKQGRFLQQDPMGITPNAEKPNGFSIIGQYSDGLNLYQYVKSNPVVNSDPYGLWDSLIHFNSTVLWAQSIWYTSEAAQVVGSADDAVDSGSTSPLPGGDQSYHFDRPFGDSDSRIEHFNSNIRSAKFLCRWESGKGDPVGAAKALGMALHPLQDWVAHGDHGKFYDGSISYIHNMKSPQRDYGYPGSYPDDITLDAKDSVDGRPVDAAIKRYEESIISIRSPRIVLHDYALYERGTKRLNLTRVKTLDALRDFKDYINSEGTCECKRYFFGWSLLY